MPANDDNHKWVHYVAEAILLALKERDPYTYGHCRRVSRMARLLAKATGLNEEQQHIIEYSSMFHDLGKIGIPDKILLKPGRLSPEEEEIMRLHPVKSAEIIKPLTHVPFFKATVPGIQCHHERVDGRGYPYGIKGEEIPLAARIILVADTFDAMTTTRPYRNGLSTEIAFKELKTFSGRQFDSQLVKIFTQAQPTWGDLEQEISDEALLEYIKRAA